MAQTKRKRRSKHRGTAGGTVVARGRTGRKPTEAESKAAAKKTDARGRKPPRYEKPPTWKGSLQRAGLVTAVFVVLTLFLLRGPAVGSLVLIPFVLIMYTVMGYYTDLWMHRRWLKRTGRPVP